jgi:ribonuclease VapC
MIIDTSALVAILDQEPEAERITRTLAATPERMLSAANLVGVGIVMQARRGDDGARDVDLLLAKLRVEIVPFTARQAEIARKAFRRYGRGRHDAKLNFGDCFAYALARTQQLRCCSRATILDKRTRWRRHIEDWCFAITHGVARRAPAWREAAGP